MRIVVFPACVLILLVGFLLAIEALAGPSASFSVNVVPASTGSSNCPSSPPPAAQRAGYTKLYWCLDGADPKNSNFTNWLDCNSQGSGTAIIHHTEGPCDSAHFFQSTDPTTSKTVIQYHENYQADKIPGDPNGAAYTSKGGMDDYGSVANQFHVPAMSYREVRLRSTLGSGNNTNVLAADMWSWNQDIQSGRCGGCAPLEKDTLEAHAGTSVHQGVINWANCDCGLSLQELDSIGSYFPNFSPQAQHSYATLVTGDNNATIQMCGYIDNVLTQHAYTGPPEYLQNCWTLALNPNTFGGGPTDTRYYLHQYDVMSLWWGGAFADSDVWLEYFAVWSCPDPSGNTCNTGLTQ